MYGLLGKSLSHSFSPEIHSLLGNPDYKLIESDCLDQFIRDKNFLGINVTIPYKEQVVPLVDHLDEIASATRSVNTIVNRDGVLFGYNTDYYGLLATIKKTDVPIQNQKILIVGNGGAAKTAKLVFQNLGAAKITKICRTIRESDEIRFDEIDKATNCDIIVNTTPIGMYPNSAEEFPFSLEKFPQLSLVIDLIYNPLSTRLLQEAASLKIPGVNGLYMLVIQAQKAHELFFQSHLDPLKANEIYHRIRNKMANLVLIGLPLSGKSLYAKKLMERFAKRVIDTDEWIEKNTGLSVSEIFEKYGEPYFRALEYDLVKTISKETGLVISTGGGMVMNADLMVLLKQNGLIIYLDKKPESIAIRKIRNRPLIKKPEDIYYLDKIRRPLYEKYADIKIEINQGTGSHIQEIEDKINEYFSD